MPAECAVCDGRSYLTLTFTVITLVICLHTNIPEVVASTDETGYTTMKPSSWDYRFSNLCNFKCRMCGPMLSSSWETEARKQGKIEPWMEPAVKEQISNYQDTQIEAEFSQAVEEHRIEEIYWVGGEPLMYDIHWETLEEYDTGGLQRTVYLRYNSNLSRTTFKGKELFDYLPQFKDWLMCASIDGTGDIVEFIRKGIVWDEWLENFKQGLSHARNQRMMRLDFTLTTPGLTEVVNICNLADELGVQILAKTTFAFTPDIAMSPVVLDKGHTT